MNIALGIMGVILFVLMLIGFYMIFKFMHDCPNWIFEFSIFYLITMSLLSVAMMRMTLP